jgi:adenosylmethionine-8-amino-7-oxononanoate aminotransferase
MSLSDIAAFKSRFSAITFETHAFDAPDRILDRDVAAVFVEPLVQAAAGMKLVPPSAYEPLAAIEPLLVVDEIATGFGRTGTMFAFEQLGLRPDAVCVGKGLTGGALALSATLVRERVYEAFLGEYAGGVHFFHGHSYAGNPIACAAALASLRLFEEEATLRRAHSIAAAIERRTAALNVHPLVHEIRRAGTMTGIELRTGARDVVNQLYDRGHFTRPIGNTVQFVPPLSSTDAEVDGFFDALEASLPA